jgi:hypothetical protein
MASSLVTRIGSVGLAGLLAAVATTLAATPKPEAETPAIINDKQFHKPLLDVAKCYTAYGRVDDEMRWAPGLCRAPQLAQARFSRSSDETTHGKKLYSLFAKYRTQYLLQAGSTVGAEDVRDKPGSDQIIVKESWIPEEVRGPDAVPSPPARRRGENFHPFATRDGKTYKAAKKGDLYIMMKLDPKTPGTDNGWVYGTVSADAKTVTSAGKVASCIQCHETKAERLFGLGGEAKKRK